jgi:hypothetical protein
LETRPVLPGVRAAFLRRSLGIHHPSEDVPQTIVVRTNVRFGSKADICSALDDVRQVPTADSTQSARMKEAAQMGGLALNLKIRQAFPVSDQLHGP